jgi:hypothetical protein
VFTVTQLTPELAEPLASALAAVFIDARQGPPEPPVTVVPLQPAELMIPTTHASDPRSLLALVQMLYGTAPPAWLVNVAGTDFALGETLSAEVRVRAAQAQICVERLIRQVVLPPVTA